MKKFCVAVDLGGTITKIGILKNGELIAYKAIDSISTKGLSERLPIIKENINSILKERNIKNDELVGVGFAFPGLVDINRKAVISTTKFNDAPDLDLEKWVTENWDTQFIIDNDSRLATIGEWKRGSARNCANLVMVTLGTGIGTGVIIKGKVLRGIHNQAGSLGGHFVIKFDGDQCSCGNIGCLETVASSSNLSNIIKKNPQVSVKYKEQAGLIDYKYIFEEANKGCKDSLLIRDESIRSWAAAIVTYIHAYDPQLIVIGGGIMRSSDIIVPFVQKYIDQYAWTPSENVKVVASELGDNAALFGIEYLLNE